MLLATAVIVLFTFICSQPTLSLVHVCSRVFFLLFLLLLLLLLVMTVGPFAGRYMSILTHVTAVVVGWVWSETFLIDGTIKDLQTRAWYKPRA